MPGQPSQVRTGVTCGLVDRQQVSVAVQERLPQSAHPDSMRSLLDMGASTLPCHRRPFMLWWQHGLGDEDPCPSRQRLSAGRASDLARGGVKHSHGLLLEQLAQQRLGQLGPAAAQPSERCKHGR